MSRWIGRLTAIASLTLLLASAAQGQNAFPTPGGSSANGAVIMCPSAANAALYVPCNSTNPATVSQASQYPVGATAITGNATGTTGAVVGTLAGVAAKTTYICGFDVSAIGGTATVGPITIAGLVGSSMVYQLSSSAAGVTFSRSFTPCIPASAVNTPITTTTTADGTATAVDVNSWGFQQ